MHTDRSARARRVAVTDPIVTAGRPYQYADAFELSVPEPDPTWPEEWMRAGMDSAPRWVDRVVSLLGIAGPVRSSTEGLGGFRIVESTADVIHLAVDVRLIRGVLVGRRIGPNGRRLTTALWFGRPVLARALWALIAPLHRRMARHILSSAILAPAGHGADGGSGR